MSSVWISSSSDSDNDLPTFSHILFKNKQLKSLNSKKSNKNCYKTLEERLTKNKNNEDILLLTKSPIKENCFKLGETSSQVLKESKCMFNKATSSTNHSINIFKPEECLKNITCFISNSVNQLFKDDDIINNLQANSLASYRTSDSEDAIVKWLCSDALIQQPEWDENEFKNSSRLLFVFEASGLSINVNDRHKSGVTHLKLEKFLESFESPQSSMVLACIGLKKFKQCLRCKLQKEYRKKVLQAQDLNNELCNVSIEKIEEYFVNIYLKYKINVIPVESKTEFVLLLSQITKAIAETPLKKKQRQNHHFINSNASLKIDPKTGDGAKVVWKQMLEQLFSVSSDISSAIVMHYPSLSSLMQAYQSSRDETGALLLSEVQIRRGVGTLQQSRRLGPELSKRIFKLFTSEDGNEVV